MLILTACHSGVDEDDYFSEVPAFMRDRTHKAPMAKPTKQANNMTRYGNPTEYHVLGKKYQVNRQVAGFKQKGTASWYGPDFHKQRTSSGEKYNMYAMTAAHKTLPLPTFVKVTNVENGRHLVVKVNDRGPFHKDRIIDLSYGAAKALGFAKKGLAKVEIEAISYSDKKTHWFLQAGAFSSAEKANMCKARLSKLIAMPVYIVKENNINYIRIGPIADRDKSKSIKQQLASHGYKDVFAYLN